MTLKLTYFTACNALDMDRNIYTNETIAAIGDQKKLQR